jgi:hypothetical protein
MTARTLFGAMLCACAASPLAAQVGSIPEKSPFRDLEIRQDVTVFAGISFGGRDRVKAGPHGGSVFGLRYDVNMGKSPLAFTAFVSRQGATREILQPGLPLTSRSGGTVSSPLWSIDGAFTLLLTGNRSWHSLVPSVVFGAGVVTDNKLQTDSSKFNFGNKFAPLLGFGVKYAPLSSRWTLRADITNRFYNVKYPQSFRDTTPGVPRIVPVNVKGSWTRNTTLTLGLVREFGRR